MFDIAYIIMYLCQSKRTARLEFRYAVASAASIKQAIYNNNVFYTVYSHTITIMDNSFFLQETCFVAHK